MVKSMQCLLVIECFFYFTFVLQSLIYLVFLIYFLQSIVLLCVATFWFFFWFIYVKSLRDSSLLFLRHADPGVLFQRRSQTVKSMHCWRVTYFTPNISDLCNEVLLLPFIFIV